MDDSIPQTRDQFISAYFAALGLPRAEKKDPRREAAFRIAHDLRKFEVELYWKRLTYFWGFQIAAFAGYGLSSSGLSRTEGSSYAELTLIVFMIGTATLGYITAGLWWAVARGSLDLQYLWERHIDLLEEEFSGNIYKTYLFRSDTGAYSITSANHWTIQTISFIWALLIVPPMVFCFFTYTSKPIIYSSLALVVWMGCLLAFENYFIARKLQRTRDRALFKELGREEKFVLLQRRFPVGLNRDQDGASHSGPT